MAKNKNNQYKNNSISSCSKDSMSSSSKNSESGSVKDTNKQFPDKRPARSGPGGE